MKKIEKLIKKIPNKNIENINQRNSINSNKSLKQKIRELIDQNDQTIKKYEKLKEKAKDSQQKMEYIKILSKYRTKQISLHNKLHGLNLIMNSFLNKYQKDLIMEESRLDTSNKNKNPFHKRINSSDYNYNAIYTNSNVPINYNRNKNKVNSSNNLNMIPKPTKFNYIQNANSNINIYRKNDTKKLMSNNKYIHSFINDENSVRLNTIEHNNISTLIKNVNRLNNIYSKSNIKNDNNKYFNIKNNIVIINNINNYYGRVDPQNIIKNNMRINEHIINKNMKKKIKDKILKYNIIDEDEQLDMHNNYNNSNKNKNISTEEEYNSEPNFVLKNKFFKVKKNIVIEIFCSYHDKNKIYIAIPEKNILGHNIRIMKLKEQKFVTRLKRHENKIIKIKHFFNRQKLHDYLISSDVGFVINVWDVSYKYSVNQFILEIKYEGEKIYNLLPAYIQQKDNSNNYLLVYDKTITIYDLKSGEYIKNVNNYRLIDEQIINLLIWKNKTNNLYYIIKCTETKINIFNFIDTDIFFSLSDYTNNEDKLKYVTGGYIISGNKMEYLCIFSYSSYLLNINLEIWDLYELSLKRNIIMNRSIVNEPYLLNIIPWNHKYILFSDGNKNLIYSINIETKEIFSKIDTKSKNDFNHIYCKKIVNKDFGESLLVWKHKNYIYLYSIKKD